MGKKESSFHFKFMSFNFKLRDLFVPRKNILKEVGIKTGFYVLDYGCGPGSYIIPLAELVGKSGRIYALDINPLAIRKVNKIAANKQLTNLATIYSDKVAELESLYDAWAARCGVKPWSEVNEARNAAAKLIDKITREYRKKIQQ